tara:strand:- start:73 stop:2055 length:1983 start_codon:yes stop_codon:yes gene_type:complete
MSLSKMIMGQSGNQGSGAGLDVDDVYSTFVYTGSNANNNSIVNNIDLSGEGGLVWIKERAGNEDHRLFDTERGVTKYFKSNSSDQQITDSNTLTAFNSNGFTLDNDAAVNGNEEFTSWTFRKAPKFFDIVTYTGNATARTIGHNLGSIPGMIWVKRIESNDNFFVYHRGNSNAPETDYLMLDQNNAGADSANVWNDTAPTATEFSINQFSLNNANGGQFIAYLFAHHDGDGEFGPTGDQDIIKCGSYTGNGSQSGNPINVGFEPQWLLIKNISNNEHWTIFDNIRGMPIGSASDASFLLASDNPGEDANFVLAATSSGFSPSGTESKTNSNGDDYIYVAIRRGPLAAPTSASQVFNTNPAVGASGNLGQHRSGFPVDFALQKVTNTTSNWTAGARLIRHKSLRPNDTNEQDGSTGFSFDYMDGWGTGSAHAERASWMWKRAPGYFDVVAYKGSSSNATYNHNLGVAPEMMWVKVTDGTTGYWVVGSNYLSNGTGWDKELRLNDNSFVAASSKFDNASSGGTATAPTATQFTVRPGTGEVNDSGKTHIAFLFASVPGVCKIGSYTGNGSTQTIDCGFSNGSKLVIIKRFDSSNGNWVIMDSVRGINAGDDPTLSINTSANNDPFDLINPQSSGFEVEEHSGSTSHKINTTGGSYLFYAIAA